MEKKSAYVFFEGNNISGNWVSFEIDNSISVKYKKIISESFNRIRVGILDINEKGNVQAINIYENGLLSNQIAYRTSSLVSLPASIRGPNLTVLLLAQLLGIGQPDWNSSLLVDENQFEYLEPDPQGGSGGSYEIYLDILFDYSNSGPAIDLQKYFNCFDIIPDNGATYSIKLCADLPDNSNPDIVVVGVTPGHAFLTITKTNGSQSVTQSFGFYPQSGPLSVFGVGVNSKIVDDGKAGFEHEVNASISMDNISQLGFNAVKNLALGYVNSLQYDLDVFNCADYALDCFNFIRSSQIIVPDSQYPIGFPIINYGTTPNGIYKNLKEMKDTNHPEAANIQIGVNNSTTSHGPCN